MTLEPFKGLRYNPKKAGPLSRVVTPPYDIISPEQQQAYYRSHPHNFIRVVLGKEYAGDKRGRDRYSRARNTLQQWIEAGILRPDPEPSFYPYEQEYRLEGRRHRRVGVIALVRLDSPKIYRHEETRLQPKLDRMRLMGALGISSSPIFGLIPDTDGEYRRLITTWCKGHRPVAAVKMAGVLHRLWRVSDPKWVAGVKRMLRNRELVIADGHHRFEAALAYRDAERAKNPRSTGPAPYDYAMFFLAGVGDEEPGLLPTHRVLRGVLPVRLAEFQERVGGNGSAQVVEKDLDHIPGQLKRWREKGQIGIGFYTGPTQGFLIRKRGVSSHRMDVEWLHHELLPKWFGEQAEVSYTQDAQEGLRLLSKGQAQAFCMMQPLHLEEVFRRARSSTRMPRKTTYFYPKPLSGLVEYKFQLP